MYTWWQVIVGTLTDVVWPRKCVVCGRALTVEEHTMCAQCLCGLPRPKFHSFTCNRITDLFENIVRPERATSFFLYSPGSPYRQILWNNKYLGKLNVGHRMGRYVGRYLAESGFLEGIDLLIPVPLSWCRFWHRGYNQSTNICKGIRRATGLQMSTRYLIRSRHTQTQVKKDYAERHANVEGAFEVHHAEELAGQHVLLVDDVLTTGATLMACVKALVEAVPDLRVSVFTLAMARPATLSIFDLEPQEEPVDDPCDDLLP